jgi:hypothetical protein
MTIVLVCLASCGRRSDPAAASRELHAMEQAYCSEDVDQAEQALRKHLSLLVDHERRGVLGYDYLFGKAMTHGRLSMLAYHQGRVGEAEENFRLFYQEYSEWYVGQGLSTNGLPQSLAQMAEFIDTYDDGLVVRWKSSSDKAK